MGITLILYATGGHIVHAADSFVVGASGIFKSTHL